MKRFVITVLLFISVTALAENTFDTYGVWHPVDTQTLSAGQAVSHGPITIHMREKYLNFLIHGAFSDSMYPVLQVYGMMTYNLADTSKAALIGTSNTYTDAETVAFADTLDDNQLYPFIWIRLTNNHPDSSATYNVWCYNRPEIQTIIRSR